MTPREARPLTGALRTNDLFPFPYPFLYKYGMSSNLKIGGIELATPVLLAPLAGYTDLPFRTVVRSFGGVGMAFTEMLNPPSMLRSKNRHREHLLATSPDDSPLGYQIYGNEPDVMVECAKWLVSERGAPLIDINMGCPQKKISGRGAGAGLLRTPELAVTIARRVVEAVSVPVTVKVRLGWHNADVAAELARQMEAVGIAAVTVHGRTKAQRFAGQSDLDGIRGVVEAVPRIPVIANGDVVSVETAREMLRRTGAAGIMIGRQALKEPWVIRDVARDLAGEAPVPPPTREERIELMMRHFEDNLRLYGDRYGVPVFRKWLPRYFSSLGMPRSALASVMDIRDPAEWRELVPRMMRGGG